MSTIISSSMTTGASGTLYVTGTASDIDTSALIQSAVEAKMAPAYRLDTQIEALEAEVAAYTEMESLLSALADAALALSSDDDGGVYDDYAAYLTASGLSDADNYLSATISEGAEMGVYEIVVEQLATTMKVASAEMAEGDTLGVDGTFTLVADGYDGAEIELAADMSLSDVAKEINAVSSETGVVATVVRSSDGGRTLVLSSADTGTSFTATKAGGDDVLQAIGLTDQDGAFADQLQAAQDAILTLDGVTVTSSSNDIEDLMPGVSLNLYDATEGEAITLEVGQDLSGMLEAVEAFVDAFNAYRDFALTNQATEEGVGASESAVLFGDSLLKNANSALYDVLGLTVEVEGESYTLADFGITYGSDNSLEIDSATLEEALVQKADVLQAFFASSATTSDTDLGVVDMPSSLASGDYALEVTTDTDGSILSATLNGVEMTVSGATIKGPTGSAFEGMRLVYTGEGDASLTVSVRRGLADAMVGVAETFADDLLPDTIESLQGTIDDKQERRDSIAASAEDHESYLISYYARLEAEIEAANLALEQLEALLNAADD